MDFVFLFFIFSVSVLIIGGSFMLFTNGQAIFGGIYFVGTVIAAVIFGLRWFLPSGDINRPGTVWPPVVNTCPDFLSLYQVGDTPVCIDTVGVAKTGGISKWTDPSQTQDQYVFNLFTNLTDLARAKKLCEEAEKKKVTWEGVFDGSTCANVNPPYPPKRVLPTATARAPAPAPAATSA